MENQYDIKALEALLEKAGKLTSTPVEETLFSIGGRGYYENPTSDILAFFLRPDGEHGLGTLFMEALLDSMPRVGNSFPVFEGALEHFTVDRERDTGGGGRIDFLMRGHDWVMLIENKIYHTQNNPFDDYERFGKAEASGKALHLVILSPSGNSPTKEWCGISYETYCAKLKSRLGEFFIDARFSKWHLFAREFVIHIENELYAKSMNEEQIRLIEENQSEIAQLQKMKENYRVFLTARLRMIMVSFFDEEQIRIKDERWALRCHSEAWGQSDIAWYYHETKFELYLSIYLEDPSCEQIEKLERELDAICPMDDSQEGAWRVWCTRDAVPSRQEGEEILRKFIEALNLLFPHRKKPIEDAAMNQ